MAALFPGTSLSVLLITLFPVKKINAPIKSLIIASFSFDIVKTDRGQSRLDVSTFPGTSTSVLLIIFNNLVSVKNVNIPLSTYFCHIFFSCYKNKKASIAH
jgi:hypothetical protein